MTRNFLKNDRQLLEEVPEISNSALSSHKKYFLKPHPELPKPPILAYFGGKPSTGGPELIAATKKISKMKVSCSVPSSYWTISAQTSATNSSRLKKFIAEV